MCQGVGRVVMAYFKVLSHHLPGGAEKSHRSWGVGASSKT